MLSSHFRGDLRIVFSKQGMELGWRHKLLLGNTSRGWGSEIRNSMELVKRAFPRPLGAIGSESQWVASGLSADTPTDGEEEWYSANVLHQWLLKAAGSGWARSPRPSYRGLQPEALRPEGMGLAGTDSYRQGCFHFRGYNLVAFKKGSHGWQRAQGAHSSSSFYKSNFLLLI